MRETDSRVRASRITAIASIIVALITSGTSVLIHLNSVKQQKEIEVLKSQIEEASSIHTDSGSVTVQSDGITSESNNSGENVPSTSSFNNNAPKMIDVDWSETSNFNDEDVFTMFGKSYDDGFTLKVRRDYKEYVTYNISSLSSAYSQIKMLVGHIDGYISADAVVEIFMDKTPDGIPDYEYTISPNLSPIWIEIDIKNHSAMTIQVSNSEYQSNYNCVGFTEFSYK